MSNQGASIDLRRLIALPEAVAILGVDQCGNRIVVLKILTTGHVADDVSGT
ncbi:MULTISPECIES: hypothetical protein [unclassified Pseudomonas]|uniref:hypothetical protein n=1 Tax=unclassified Pseudomonas TaxID=196821 RepID=UPI001297870D|nr:MULTISPECIES: hypothetical protein [unclassified Pseudomonas]MQT41836.1 hypothetical protein [Pseudomonas sp. FSL R10-0765]MQT53296.1 hypothetical protein [Pseudomonas sp. FSL R10-2398]MQU02718.1 hypothetical protein [Pseudomonas sp. FSL R10-2245]MQU13970.1 hypothetical protein [Pseudomonas sp. FSL R10-2189]MQU38953.1 hypothetical protein [Pseudomonas sp. FSL R10-2172]